MSWFPIPADSDFSIHNLPYGVFRPRGQSAARVGVALGESVLDLAALHHAGLFAHTAVRWENVFAHDALNAFMELGPEAWGSVRQRLQELLRADNPELRDNAELRQRAFFLQTDVEMLLPARIGDYSDFYASEHHASNVGRIFRPNDEPLFPNWKHLPVGYHGRASSIVISETQITRPWGQVLPSNAQSPRYQPTTELDYELELGAFIGYGNSLGTPLPIEDVDKHLFGFVLLNDWSARDIQRWEYRPLGPFLAKSFATTISPWVVTHAALEPFRVDAPPQSPPPLPHLVTPRPSAYTIQLEVWLQTAQMREPMRLSATDFRVLYWTLAQMVAHHASNGVNLRGGDLLGSGTVSGPTPSERGCLLELTWGGREPLHLPNGETRTYLENGDTVILRGYAQGEGYRVGFGEARGTVRL